MKNFLFIIPVLFMFACGGSDETTEGADNDSNSTARDSTELDTVLAFDPSTIEKGVEFENTPFNGEEIMSIGWLDSRGQNVVILSQVYEEYESIPSAWIYAAHYADGSGEMELVREVTDFIKDCDFDVILEFMDDPTITDLDGDNIAEVTLVYKLACKSDLSEDDMKVIMYENDEKWGLRGYDYLVYPNEEKPTDYEPNAELVESEDAPDYYFMRGRFNNDDDFKNAPEGFLDHARQVWLDNCFIELL